MIHRPPHGTEITVDLTLTRNSRRILALNPHVPPRMIGHIINPDYSRNGLLMRAMNGNWYCVPVECVKPTGT